jgi:hypothetical protein
VKAKKLQEDNVENREGQDGITTSNPSPLLPNINDENGSRRRIINDENGSRRRRMSPDRIDENGNRRRKINDDRSREVDHLSLNRRKNTGSKAMS